MSEERKRPIKQFRVLAAFGPYIVGAKIQPTGIYRDTLLRRGVIEEVKDDAELDLREARPEMNRMVPAGEMASRGRRTRA